MWWKKRNKPEGPASRIVRLHMERRAGVSPWMSLGGYAIYLASSDELKKIDKKDGTRSENKAIDNGDAGDA